MLEARKEKKNEREKRRKKIERWRNEVKNGVTSKESAEKFLAPTFLP